MKKERPWLEVLEVEYRSPTYTCSGARKCVFAMDETNKYGLGVGAQRFYYC